MLEQIWLILYNSHDFIIKKRPLEMQCRTSQIHMDTYSRKQIGLSTSSKFKVIHGATENYVDGILHTGMTVYMHVLNKLPGHCIQLLKLSMHAAEYVNQCHKGLCTP